jgi:aminoglycoside 6-adenylyltransferase
MRDKAEMMALIIEYAINNDQVRAVVMNGSRTNPSVIRDPFQDYDIVYIVKDVAPFRRNSQVVDYFGEILILQLPDDMQDPTPESDGSYAYLMQFMDGNRIDLGFYALERAQQCVEDSLSIVLLDKDNLFSEIPPASELSYLPKPPTAKQFDDCCNEFWWVNPYMAKGLWRGDLIYAKNNQEMYIRPELLKMLNWYFGVLTDFKIAPGKLGKKYKSHIGEELWSMLLKTYSDASVENSWQSLFAMGDLFRIIAQTVAKAFGFVYHQQEDANVSAYIRKIKALPPDAQTID